MNLNQQEQDIVDLLMLHKVMTADHLCQELHWGTAKLHPMMAVLVQKGLVLSDTDKKYPHTTTYQLKSWKAK